MNACMGGWCAKRAQCPHYHATRLHDPSERLCLRGEDGVQLVRVGGEAVEIHVFTNHKQTADYITPAEAAA